MNKVINFKESASISKIAMLSLPLLLFGCNTMEGLGTDIKETGKSLERSAEKNKQPSHPPPCPCCAGRCR
jgi:predicted small secreted protein